MMKICEMKPERVKEYACLFRDVFNGEPWWDHWTLESAEKRLRQFMGTGQFLGYAMEKENRVVGLICGQREEYYDGPRFCIQEFCVDSRNQGRGWGKELLEYLSQALKQEGITYLYLMTQRGERTQGYYQRRGFQIDEELILMHKKG